MALSTFVLIFLQIFLLVFTWFHVLVQTALGDVHPGYCCSLWRIHIFGWFAVALPTCFVEGISVGVAGRLLGRFCRVHTGIRFNTIHRQRKTEIKPSGPENPRVFIPHMFPVCLPVPPSPLAGFLSFCRPLGLFGVSGRLASFLSIVPGPTSLSAAVRQGLSTSLPLSLSLSVPPLPLSLALSLSRSQFNSLTCISQT